MDLPPLGLSPDAHEYCTIEATVVTGFENLAKKECSEKFGVVALPSRGRIVFDVPVDLAPKVLQLRSVDSIYVLIFNNSACGFESDKEESLSKIKAIITQCHWEKGLNVWKSVTGYVCESSRCNPSSEDRIPMDEHPADLGEKLKFRVTCYRSQGEHSFGSPDAAGHFGAAVKDNFNWKVDMTKFDLEVVLNVVGDQTYVGLALTRQSLHKRNITCFGITTLRATIAYNLLHLADIRDDDVVCDPMCGSGSIPIEGAVAYSSARYLCGDSHPVAVERTLQNLINLNDYFSKKNMQKLNLGIFRWDATCLPLRSNSVNVLVTDLPFGKRSGSKLDNRVLYPKLLKEFARVCCEKTGRAVLLTQDRRTMTNALYKTVNLWKSLQTLTINIGGLAAGVYLLQRKLKTAENPTKKQKYEAEIKSE